VGPFQSVTANAGATMNDDTLTVRDTSTGELTLVPARQAAAHPGRYLVLVRDTDTGEIAEVPFVEAGERAVHLR
jgi:hypothetical protein